jgi:hypothetical protein
VATSSGYIPKQPLVMAMPNFTGLVRSVDFTGSLDEAGPHHEATQRIVRCGAHHRRREITAATRQICPLFIMDDVRSKAIYAIARIAKTRAPTLGSGASEQWIVAIAQRTPIGRIPWRHPHGDGGRSGSRCWPPTIGDPNSRRRYERLRLNCI